MASKQKNLNQMASGAGIGLLGSVAGSVLQLASGLIMVRLVAPVEYGLYTLAAVFVAMAATLANMGFGNGAPQLIAKYLAVSDFARARGIVMATLGVVAAVSAVLTAATFVFSAQLAALFGKPELTRVLNLFSLILWPSAMILALISIFRGFASTWPKVLFDELLNRLMRIIGLLLVAFMGWGLSGIVWITVVTTLISFVAFSGYAWRTMPRLLPPVQSIWGGRELVRFSFPLFGNNVIEILMVSASTLLLGYFKSADFVGQYNVAVTLSRLLEMPLIALAFIYLPIATAVHGGQGGQGGQGSQEVEKLYLSSTKWIAVVTLPVFLGILVDAEFIVGLLFGKAYLPAANVLRVLAVGYFMHVALGPNGVTLLAFGTRRAIFLSTAIAALINIVLGVVLMPLWGAMGAAIAVALALSVSNIFISVKLYMQTGIHPLKAAYMRPLAVSGLAGILSAGLVWVFPFSSGWKHFFLLGAITLVCLASPIITRSIDESDLSTLGAIERKLSKKMIITDRLRKWCLR
ncbi:flippase [Sulfurirhabdus autotrophica]|uniref:O-antigen/teichoic acid export membrane protein n=1 Tax=Sulfurirhabdus autotrophica TaxID=1706046 RepID=A0A4R3XVX2_9PROT|nr:flippase [Sulfurirhabdus autotrophica]TCV83436.1 O-antigen/teichoic acid export membrane protein [Sulfurirhabdus autotrophica]